MADNWLSLLSGKTVLHRDSGVIGKVKTIHEANEFKPLCEGKPLAVPVVELEDGNSFLAADESAWWILSESEVKLNQLVKETIQICFYQAVAFGKALQIPIDRGVEVIEGAYRAQLRAFATEHGRG